MKPSEDFTQEFWTHLWQISSTPVAIPVGCHATMIRDIFCSYKEEAQEFFITASRENAIVTRQGLHFFQYFQNCSEIVNHTN